MSGLSAMRKLRLAGHGNIKDSKPSFPYKEIIKEVLEPSSRYSVVKVPHPPKDADSSSVHWSILEGKPGDTKGSANPLYGLARRIAISGKEIPDNIPYFQFGNIFSVDRIEIEHLRGIKSLITDYLQEESPLRPLSLAVFGPPGSGKSFGIKQVAKALLGEKVPILEFNLSQFSKSYELVGAFHQVRDKVLEGETPFVFWDEFDSHELKWLIDFLAPMQDGKFKEGQLNHPIGKCIFVFAGGTSYQMENFAPKSKDRKKFEKFKMAKGPDFESRLKGFLNVLGPNKRQKYDQSKKIWLDDTSPVDTCFPVRRALLLRSMMGLKGDDKMDIDEGLLHAFLEIDNYKHGARSMDILISRSKTSKAQKLMRSSLPPHQEMSMHVDYNKFMDIVNRDSIFKINSELLAPAVHEFYRKLCKTEGWPVKYDMEYSELPEEIKADNLAAASRIPDVLSQIGLLIVPEAHEASPIDPGILVDNIELLAEAEHDGWMAQKYRSGWRWGIVRDDSGKIHDAMIPYRELSEGDKKKDRNSVRSYPEIVKIADFKIVHKK